MFEVLCKEDVYYDWHLKPRPMYTNGEYYVVDNFVTAPSTRSIFYGMINNEGVYDWINSKYFENVEKVINEKLESIL